MGNKIQGKWPLYITWVIVFMAVVLITLSYELESTSFYGIAETKELVVNSENSVEIKRINVVEGQSISKGRMLVELSSPELMLKINQISHQLEQLKAQKGVNKAEVLSRIDQLKAEKIAKRSEINNQIRQLENRQNINKSLTVGLKSINGDDIAAVSNANNPVKLEIDSLKQELTLSIRPIDIQLDLLEKALSVSEDPVEIQVERLEKELDLLGNENDKLNIYSQISGIIGSVNFKTGEKAAPFVPILTLHTRNPSLIKGYIYENVYTRVSMGNLVEVTSLTDTMSRTTGSVVGVGARIVEYPVRLRKHPEFQVWGREVIIRIQEDNPFILGEKVLISAYGQEKRFFQKLKNLFFPDEAYAKNAKIEHVDLPIVPLKTTPIEASAVLYLDDIERYLVLSDETPDNKPLLFLMDRFGSITKEATISGLKKINDMESIAVSDNGTIYIASSLSVNKEGKLNLSRKLLVTVERKKDRFKLVKKMNIHALLINNAEKHMESDWARFIMSGYRDMAINIEGMFYRSGALYLGFKSPLKAGRSVILKIDRIDELFDDIQMDQDQVSIWKSFRLKEGEGFTERISGLFYNDGILYITGTLNSKGESKKSGSLWKYEELTGKVTCIEKFKELKPEGIAAGPKNDNLLICFDQGNTNLSRILFIKVKQ